MSHAKDATTASQNPEPAGLLLPQRRDPLTALSHSSIYRRVTGEFHSDVARRTSEGWRREALQAWIGDPSGFRPLTDCEVQQSASGARVRRVAAP